MSSTFTTESFFRFTFQLFASIKHFDLGNIFRSICFPFVFLFICYFELIEFFSQSNFNLPEIVIPKPYVSPLFLINDELQSLTISNLRKLQSAPKRIKKQSLIDSYLELASL